MSSLGPLGRLVITCLLTLTVISLLATDFIIRKQALKDELLLSFTHAKNDLSTRISSMEYPIELLNTLITRDLQTTHPPSPETTLKEVEYHPETNHFSIAFNPQTSEFPTESYLEGAGDIRDKDPEYYREIAITLKELPMMSSMLKTMPALRCIYYFSREKFVFATPSLPAPLNSNHNEDFLLQFYDMARPYQNPDRELFWSQASYFPDTDELTTSVIKPVYTGSILRGLAVLEVDIPSLLSNFPENIEQIGRLLLIDTANQVISDGTANTNKIRMFNQVLPEQVVNFINHPFDIDSEDFTQAKGISLIRQNVTGTDWHLILEISQSELNGLVIQRMYADLAVALLFIVLLVLLQQSLNERFKLQDSRERHAAIFSQSTAPQIIVGPDGNQILNANLAACTLFGFSHQTLKNIPLTNMIVGKTSAQDLYNCLSKKGVTITKCRIANGQEKDLEIYTSMQPHKNRVRFYLVIHDITERVRTEQHVRYQAYFDPLTQLPNRNHLFEHLRQLVASHHREDQTLALLFIDLDRFKQVNDNLGHDIGDILLQQVTQRLRNRLRESDLLARLGGDEFTVVLPHLRDEMDASHVAKTLITQLEESFHIDSYEIALGASIGITIYPRDGNDPSTLLKHADIAMYKAKDNGRNQFRFFEDQMNREAKHRGLLEIDIQSAVRSNQFLLKFQPIFSVKEGNLKGIDTLLRWDHPRLGILKPEDFMFIAEETGVIVDIGDWALQQAYQLYKRLFTQFGPEGSTPFIALNISRRQMMHESHLKRWRETLLSDSRFAKSILLEMTETTLNTQLLDEHFGLSSLLSMGPKICLYDFGQSQSSLKVLRKLPISLLKLDRMMSNHLQASTTDTAFFRGVIFLAKTLGIQVAAEGVDNKDQYEWLCNAGCDYIQGNYLGREVSPEEIILLLQQQSV